MISLKGILKGLRIQDPSDRTKQLVIQVDASATPGTTTTIVASQTADRTIVLPDGGSFVTPSSTDTFTNKSMDGDTNTFTDISISSLKPVLADALKVLARDASGAVISTTIENTSSVFLDASFQIQNTSDHTKIVQFNTFNVSPSSIVTLTVPDEDITLLGTVETATVQNKTLDETNAIHARDDRFRISSAGDSTKRVQFDPSNVPSATTITLSTPDASTTIVGTDATQDISNKTFLDAINNAQISTPSNPSASHNKLYFKSNNNLYSLNSSGTETLITPTATPVSTVTKITTGSGTYNTPVGARALKVTCIGAGGGSGGISSTTGNAAASGGGGGGATGITYITSPDPSYAYNVGAGGAAGTAGANTGSNGTDTTFGSSCTAGGGSGGTGGSATTALSAVAGGVGGIPGTGTVVIGGTPGGQGLVISASGGIGGNGGASSMGPTPQGKLNSGGVANGGFGSGAAGRSSIATQNVSGNNGQDGLILIEEYY